MREVNFRGMEAIKIKVFVQIFKISLLKIAVLMKLLEVRIEGIEGIFRAPFAST